MNEWLIAYLALGALTGFIAGLLGAGGGGILVPVLAMMFAAQHFSDAHLMHLALGTSMATIVFTSIASFRAHHRHGAVMWPVVKSMAPGIVVGTLVGTQVASYMPSRALGLFFAAFMSYVALQLVLSIRPKPSRRLPGIAGMFGVGAGIGSISSLVAIGGASLTVPFMTWCNVKMQNAIGTSSALGFPIAVAGTVGYAISGYETIQRGGLPTGSLGFIYLPALAGTVLASVVAAPYGARVAHRLPVATLRKILACVLVLVVVKMLHLLFA